MTPKMLPDKLRQLLTLLSGDNYHSGTDIGEQLGLTRSGVWKLVKQLEALGVTLDSVSNKGYRLHRPVELLQLAKINHALDAAVQADVQEIFIFDEITSTNDYLMQYARTHKGRNAICLAERQTAGRGRLGRQWVSPFAANLYFSLLWHFDQNVSELGGLNLVLGVTLADVIAEITHVHDVKLKWPNDLYWQDRKLGGVLIDIVGEFSGGCAAVIGIGINVNMPEALSRDIEKPWVDLQTMVGRTVSRNRFVGCLVNRLVDNLRSHQRLKASPLLSAWHARDYLLGKRVTIQTLKSLACGVAEGVTESGYLLIKTDDGEQIALTTGDASVVSYR